MKNPFEEVLSPNCPEREAEFNRGSYYGFEKARKTYEPIITDLSNKLKALKRKRK